MRHLTVYLLCCALLLGCATRPPRCTGRFEPINADGAPAAVEAEDGE